MNSVNDYWVFPFGNLRINVCLPLPEAYRSLPRPSSATNAKAFTMYPYYLDTLFLHLDETCYVLHQQNVNVKELNLSF